MLTLIDLAILPIYAHIIPIYTLTSVFCALFNLNIVEVIWVALLDRFFTLTESYLAPIYPKPEEKTKLDPILKPSDSQASLLAYDESLIERDVHLTEHGIIATKGFVCDANSDFKLHHPIYLVKSGIEAIIEDDVTKRFSAGELRVWNFLSRNQGHHFAVSKHNWLLNLIWALGFLFRYLVLFPCRIVTFILAFFLTWWSGLLIIALPNGLMKEWARTYLYTGIMRMNLRPYSAVVRFYNTENRPKPNSICVSNHTTPVDYAVLSSDIAYSAVGQIHTGFFGLIERVLSKGVPMVWFDRSESLDRSLTAKKLKEHVATPGSPPVLIFPEGTCINNTSVMKFKKGCFEIGAPVYPVCIKYDPRYADCFWNSSQDTLLQSMVKIMTSWAMVVDVWYLPVQNIEPDEDGASFARRVRQMIAERGGMVDMDWDGEYKRKPPRDEHKESQQRLFTNTLNTDQTHN